MFFSYTTPSAFAPHELERLKTARPASRTEVLEQHLRDNRNNAVSIMASQVLSTEAAHAGQTPERPRLARITPLPMITVRRGLSRALMSAAERIGPEAA
jgi:hypothetical protein